MKLENEGQLSLAQDRQSSRTGHAGSDHDWDFHLGGSSPSLVGGERETSKEPKKPCSCSPTLPLSPSHVPDGQPGMLP